MCLLCLCQIKCGKTSWEDAVWCGMRCTRRPLGEGELWWLRVRSNVEGAGAVVAGDDDDEAEGGCGCGGCRRVSQTADIGDCGHS